MLIHALLLLLPIAIAVSAPITAQRPALTVRLNHPLTVATTLADLKPETDATPAPPRLGVPIGMHYFKSSEVDKRAEPATLAPLVYPEAAFAQQIPGKVVLAVYINESGTIDGIDVVSATPPGIFEQAAIDAVINSRFTPAQLFGRPVKNVKTIEITFNPLSEAGIEGSSLSLPQATAIGTRTPSQP